MTRLKASEVEIQRDIIGYLLMRGHFAFRVNTMGVPMWSGKAFSGFRPAPTKGISDILGVTRDGTFFAIEVKAEKGIPTTEQLAFLDRVAGNGGIAMVARSVQDVIDMGL